MFTTIDEFIPDGEAFDSGLGSVVSSQGEYGYIMNIYVNIQFILNKLEELKNPEDNKVTLIDFLNTILSSINGALGGVNALEATIDETTNEVIIRDSNPFPEQDAILTRLGKSTNNALFSFIGYRGSGGRPIASFIKDFSFTTEISPALSTMITVGASANSTVVGEDSTAFSKFNNGLTDRYKESISDDPKDLDATAKAAAARATGAAATGAGAATCIATGAIAGIAIGAPITGVLMVILKSFCSISTSLTPLLDTNLIKS